MMLKEFLYGKTRVFKPFTRWKVFLSLFIFFFLTTGINTFINTTVIVFLYYIAFRNAKRREAGEPI